MTNAAARGKTLLASPVAFKPLQPQTSSVRAYLISLISGFFCCNSDFCYLVAVIVICTFMQPRQLGFRPLQTSTTACSFVFTGTGAAILVHHSILEFLYTPDTVNLDIIRLGRTAAACWVATSRWTQVDTPSLATQVSFADSSP